MLTKDMMAEFEELIDGQMDHLYAGALFMTGGDAEQAEELLLDTVTWASGTYREQPPDSDHQRWMDGILAQRLLVLVVAPSRVPPDNDPLLVAAGTLSLPARAALWLTLICRWSYRDTAHVLSLNRAQLVELLSSRHTLYSAISSEDAGDRTQATGWPKSRSGAR